MHHRFFNLIAVGLLFSVGLSGCSCMTAQGRAEMKYRHYVQKNIKRRQKLIVKAQKAANHRMKKQQQAPQQPGPESFSGPTFTSGNGTIPTGPAPASVEQNGAPMTVYAPETAGASNSEPTP